MVNFFKVIGARSARREHFLLLLALTFIAGLFVYNNLLWRWDNLLYDAQLSFWSRDAPEDIVIIAIDDESLNDLGRWPWSRSLHAELIQKLQAESAKAIGLDIIFSEPDANHPQSDIALANAIKSAGNIVLPVFMTQESNNSYPIEALPLPKFTNNAAALGHVHIDTSDDGIARKVFLREGIGEPEWQHYSLALLMAINEEIQLDSFSKQKVDDKKTYSPLQWSRESAFLIPYAGPPGHFQQIGYSQVMRGEFQQGLFRDKIVLVGATAEGLGDTLPTPLSGNSGSMPGVEIIANVIDALRNNLHISELETPWLIVITVILIALPLLIYPFVNPANALWVLLCAILMTLIFSALLLLLFGIWLPVATALLFQLIAYPLWSWRRLEMAMRHINVELDQLSTMQKSLSIHRQRNVADEIAFISQFVAIKGWVLQDENGQSLLQDGTVPVDNLSTLKEQGWGVDGYRYWAYTDYDNQRCKLGLSLGVDVVVTNEVMRLLDSLIQSSDSDVIQHKYAEDVLQKKIQQVQMAGKEYEGLRRIIDDSLTGMAHGVLICSNRGQVMLSNRRAGLYLMGDNQVNMNGEPLAGLLKNVQPTDGVNWKDLLQKVLLRQIPVLTKAQHETGRDLMVEISPLKIVGDVFEGFVINFSDISMLTASERKRNQVLNFLSHDLRSPLASMLAMIELAKSKLSLEEMRSLLVNMEGNTQKTLHLAEQFLQLSRATTSERIKFYDIDFNSVVLNAIDQIWALSNKMKVTIKHEFDHDEVWTNAEPDLLERAIVNLLSNAIKHSESGENVTVSVELNNNEISCCVIDNGSGIPADELPHLFEMFMRTKSVGIERKQGIGLGLAFVDAVAKRHSGHVDVESRQGEGSSFCLKFPQAELQE